jgi:glycerophosphoryl diester phosphodiesterase
VSFLNIAHRGARAFAPENTLPAVRLAKRLGANVVELDVQMSRDDELVVFHDDTVVRCSDAVHTFTGRRDYAVGSFTLAELASLDVGTWFTHELAKPPGERQPFLRDLTAAEAARWISRADVEEYESGSVRIPQLREALTLAQQCGLAVVLDVKTIPGRYSGIAEQTVALVRELGMQDVTMITSFDHVLLADVRRQDSAIATGVLTGDYLRAPREYLEQLDADAFEPRISELDPDARGMIRELTDAGLLVNVWTENDVSGMRALIDAGVTGIFSDYPNRLSEALAELGRPVGLTGFRRRRQSSM